MFLKIAKNLPKDIIERIENESRNYKKAFKETTRRSWEHEILNNGTEEELTAAGFIKEG